jgi:hypothetical protein
MVEDLSIKHRALNSNPTTTGGGAERKREKRGIYWKDILGSSQK